VPSLSLVSRSFILATVFVYVLLFKFHKKGKRMKGKTSWNIFQKSQKFGCYILSELW